MTYNFAEDQNRSEIPCHWTPAKRQLCYILKHLCNSHNSSNVGCTLTFNYSFEIAFAAYTSNSLLILEWSNNVQLKIMHNNVFTALLLELLFFLFSFSSLALILTILNNRNYRCKYKLLLKKNNVNHSVL